jgi:hypothetical protein
VGTKEAAPPSYIVGALPSYIVPGFYVLKNQNPKHGTGQPIPANVGSDCCLAAHYVYQN